MSTRTDATYDSTTGSRRTDDELTTGQRTEETADFSPFDTDTHQPTETTSSSEPTTENSWVDRCQRQFESGDTARLKNLSDDENEAMAGGI